MVGARDVLSLAIPLRGLNIDVTLSRLAAKE